MTENNTPAALTADLLTIELGTAAGDVVWTIRAWECNGFYGMSKHHNSGVTTVDTGNTLSERALDADIRLALANSTGWMVLSDSTGRMEEGARL